MLLPLSSHFASKPGTSSATHPTASSRCLCQVSEYPWHVLLPYSHFVGLHQSWQFLNFETFWIYSHFFHCCLKTSAHHSATSEGIFSCSSVSFSQGSDQSYLCKTINLMIICVYQNPLSASYWPYEKVKFISYHTLESLIEPRWPSLLFLILCHSLAHARAFTFQFLLVCNNLTLLPHFAPLSPTLSSVICLNFTSRG